MHFRKKRLLCAALAGALAFTMAPVSTAFAAADSIFVLGNQYDEVKQIQQKLKSLGYLESEPTGYFGTETQRALIAFQKDKGLTADGKAGPATQKALLGVVYPSKRDSAQTQPDTKQKDGEQQDAAKKEESGTKSVSSSNIAAGIFIYGNTFDEVKQIQQKLKDLGYFKGNVTGYFDKDTEQAVRAFQKDKGLSVDGKVGPATQKALLGATIPSPRAAMQNNTSNTASTPGGTSLGTSSGNTGSTLGKAGSVFVFGCSYNEVKEIQQKLKELGYMSASATGYYGSETLKAVTNFQSDKGLNVDGKAGPATQMALLGKTLTASKSTATNVNTSNNPPQAPSVGSSQKGQQTVNLAKQHQGKPYVWGGNGPASFDCSGFVVYVLKQQGYQSRYRNSYWMSQDSTWKQVAWKDMKPGDLMFFDTRTDGSAPIGHVGIYIGNGQMIHASSGSGKIVIAGVTSGYFKDRFRIARRVFY